MIVCHVLAKMELTTTPMEIVSHVHWVLKDVLVVKKFLLLSVQNARTNTKLMEYNARNVMLLQCLDVSTVQIKGYVMFVTHSPISSILEIFANVPKGTICKRVREVVWSVLERICSVRGVFGGVGGLFVKGVLMATTSTMLQNNAHHAAKSITLADNAMTFSVSNATMRAIGQNIMGVVFVRGLIIMRILLLVSVWGVSKWIHNVGIVPVSLVPFMMI